MGLIPRKLFFVVWCFHFLHRHFVISVLMLIKMVSGNTNGGVSLYHNSSLNMHCWNQRNPLTHNSRLKIFFLVCLWFCARTKQKKGRPSIGNLPFFASEHIYLFIYSKYLYSTFPLGPRQLTINDSWSIASWKGSPWECWFPNIGRSQTHH